LVATGQKRQFYYQKPFWNVEQSGAKSGALLFDGRRDGNQYSGTAYIFSKRCGAVGYQAAGPVSSDERQIVLRGQAPVRDSSCNPSSYRDDKLVFNFVFKTEADGPPPPFPFTSGQSLRTTILNSPRESFAGVVQAAAPSNTEIAGEIIQSIGAFYDISTCYYSPDAVTLKNKQEDYFIYAYLQLANAIAGIRTELPVVGYPESVWKVKLDLLANGSLDELIRRKTLGEVRDYEGFHTRVKQLEADLVDSLESYRQRTDPRLLSSANHDFCGGDFWGHFAIKLVPDQGKVWIIKGTNYEWCKKLGYTTVDSCDLWDRVLPSNVLPFGRYWYRAEWSDGVKDSGNFSVDTVQQDGATIQIRKPQ